MFPGLGNQRRKFVHDLADTYEFHHNSRGGSRNRCLYVSTSFPVTLLSKETKIKTATSSKSFDTSAPLASSSPLSNSVTTSIPSDSKSLSQAQALSKSVASSLSITNTGHEEVESISNSLSPQDIQTEQESVKLEEPSSSLNLNNDVKVKLVIPLSSTSMPKELISSVSPTSSVIRPYTHLPFIKDLLVFPGDEVLLDGKVVLPPGHTHTVYAFYKPYGMVNSYKLYLLFFGEIFLC